MSLGKAAVYKHIPAYYPGNVGAVGGLVGMIGGLGGFVLPIAFGALNDLTGLWSSCFMLLFVLVGACLVDAFSGAPDRTGGRPGVRAEPFLRLAMTQERRSDRTRDERPQRLERPLEGGDLDLLVAPVRAARAPGPKLTASIPRDVKSATFVHACFGSSARSPTARSRWTSGESATTRAGGELPASSYVGALGEQPAEVRLGARRVTGPARTGS